MDKINVGEGAQLGSKETANPIFEIEWDLGGFERGLEHSPMIYKPEEEKEQREEILDYVDVIYKEVEESWLREQLWEIFVLSVNGILSGVKFVIVILVPLILSGVFFVVKHLFLIVKMFLVWVVKMLTRAGAGMTKEVAKEERDFDRMDYGGKFVIVNYGDNVNIQVNQKN